MKIDEILTSAVVAATVSTIVAPLLFFFLKRRDDRTRRTFDIRFSAYKQYLQTLEGISSTYRQDFELSMSETYAQCLSDILKQERESSEALIYLSNKANELTSSIRQSFSQATQELHGLRLVCSCSLLELVDEFIAIQRELIDCSVSAIAKLNQINIEDPESIVSGEIKVMGERSEVLLKEIVTQMRKELDVK